MVKGSMGVAKVPVAEVVIQYKFSTAGDCRREIVKASLVPFFRPTSGIVAKTIGNLLFICMYGALICMHA